MQSRSIFIHSQLGFDEHLDYAVKVLQFYFLLDLNPESESLKG